MRWEDERYVRVYTRDTVTWLSLSWEARALLLFIFRKCDRAGLIELGEDGVAGLAVVVGMPLDVVEKALVELTRGKDPPLQLRGATLLVPHFLEAQEAHASPKARMNAFRERQRARNAVETPRHGSLPSQAETLRNEDETPRNQSVTQRNGLTTPSRADPAEPSVPSDHDLQIDPKEKDRSAAKVRSSEQQVFDHWTKARGKHNPKFTEDRRRKIRARLREGYTVEQLVTAINGVAKDPWEERRLHDDLAVILRDGAHVEKFLALAVAAAAATNVVAGNGRVPNAAEETKTLVAQYEQEKRTAVSMPPEVRKRIEQLKRGIGKDA